MTNSDISEEELKSEIYAWEGDDKSIEILEYVFQYLGGRNRWANLKSVYVHYLQKDGALGEYPSIQYQSLDSVKMVVDQMINDFRFTRILNEDLGWLINEGEVSDMDETNRKFLTYWLELDYYRKLHLLAIGEDLLVRFTDQYQIIVLKEGKYFCGFELDQQLHPVIYHRPKFNNQNISIQLMDWKEIDGYLIPGSGKAVEGDFEFTIKEWIPGYEGPSIYFEVPFNPDYIYVAYDYGVKPFGS